ncbi:MAG: hypothetical protein K8R67_18345 [Desulfobacteraceae bacterium]|nr:hypothetical protein [Desulfobacteraceae bacterium]
MGAKEIQKSIEKYALSYAELQGWQEKSEMIPIGDQKTGCIGEFYAYLYLIKLFPNSKISYAGHSEKGWDIEIRSNLITERIQVKTVSAYSTTRVLSPIHDGWNQLFIIYLDKSFKPLGFWTIKDVSIVKENGVLKSRKCRKPDNLNSGSKDIPFGKNRVKELIVAIDSATSA